MKNISRRLQSAPPKKRTAISPIKSIKAAKQEAIENQEPLTRSSLKEKSAEKKDKAGMTNARVMTEWYTPSGYMESGKSTVRLIVVLWRHYPELRMRLSRRNAFTKEHDGLQQGYQGSVYLNPPLRNSRCGIHR